MPLCPGSRLGPYAISGPLGKGGMGEVFRARDTRLERDVAVKALPEEFAQDPERLARFQREARVLASLNHANVASIYGLEESDGRSYLVLECVEGETLAARLAQGPLPVEEALRVAAGIASGVAAAHDAGIIHRDLKPGNVMLRSDGTVKVLDFGLAKAGDRTAGSADESRSPTLSLGTQMGVVLGTAAYMSPEQARGRALDKRSDIFSFGCVLYECLTGKRAFPGQTVSDTLSAIVADEPDWAALPRGTPARARELLERCLRKDPRRRIHDIADARLELEEALAAPATASAAGAAPSSQVAPRKPRRVLGWLAGGALLGAAATAAIFAARRPQAPHAAMPRIEAVLPLPEGVLLAPGNRPGIALSPDGTTIVFRAIQGNASRLFRRRLDGGESVALAGTEGGFGPFFSPDGEWVGFFTPYEVKKVPLGGGVPVRLCASTPVSHGGTWPSDGFIVFSRTSNGGLYRVPDTGGKSELFVPLAAGEHALQWPQTLPGASGILVSIVKGTDFQDIDSAEIAVLEPKTSRRRRVLEGSTYARYVEPGRILFIRGKAAFAAPFDLAALSVMGSPVALPGDLLVDPVTGIGHFAAAGDALVSANGPPPVRPPSNVRELGRSGAGALLPLPAGDYSHPRLSPDGNRIAFTRLERVTAKLFVFDRSRQDLSLLASEPGRFFCPVWSPDGNRIAFTWFHLSEPRLALKRVDGSGTIETPVPDVHHAEFPSSWSSDGKTILYTIAERSSDLNQARVPTDIWAVTLDSPPRAAPWLAGPFRKSGPAFSPDGRRVAYVSDESGQDEIYLAPYPGPGTRTKISSDGGSEPAWTRQGREIIYRHGDDFLSVELSGDASAGAPKRLFSGVYNRGDGREDYPREYDVSSDGGAFIVIEQTRPPVIERQLVVRTRWFDSGPERSPRR